MTGRRHRLCLFAYFYKITMKLTVRITDQETEENHDRRSYITDRTYFLNAVFASAEIAVISTNEAKLEKLSEEGDKKRRDCFL